MGGPVIETIRPGVQFTPEAARAFRRAEAQVQAELGRDIDVNSTYRDYNLQLSMWQAWEAWVVGRGPKPNHSKALHPDDPLAFHTKGLALDSDDWVNARIVAILAGHGFIRNRLYVKGEDHHFEYLPDRDQHRNDPASTPAVPTPQEDNNMALGRIRVAQKGNKNGKTFIALPNPRAHADAKQKPYIAIVETADTKGVEWEIDARNQFTYNYIERYFEGVNQG